MNYKPLTSFDLKIIALVTMIIDHIGVVFFKDVYLLRIIGRIALVLYAFMIAEGISKTHDVRSYLKKLFVFALISEIPFDLFFYNQVFYFDKQNILWTLFISATALAVFNSDRKLIEKIFAGLLSYIAATALNFEYSWYGVTLIFIFFFVRKAKTPLQLLYKYLSIEIASIIFSITNLFFQIFAFIGFIPILMYNGKLGKKLGTKYYWFYPIHLIILWICSLLIK